MVRIFDLEELAVIREHYRGKRIVLVTGVFDLTHPGHALFLEAARALGDVLVAGVGNDAQVGLLKPGRPFWPQEWRALMIASLKPVDFCFIGPPETVEHPLKIVELALETFRPDIYAVNDDAFDVPHRKLLAEQFGAALMVIERSAYPPAFAQLSTSVLLERIRTSG